MATTTAAMPPSLRDETARIAVERVTEREPGPRLWVSIGERCGEALKDAFVKMGLAYYSGK